MMISSCFENKKKKEPSAAEYKISPGINSDTFPRKNITFILGKDENTRNPYYSLANQYYRLSDSEKTEIVIDTIYTLLDVRNYLEKHRPENNHPWGIINLVSHGNEFIDLSVLVSKTGSRVSEKSLQEAIDDSLFKPLDSRTIDKKTIFNLHGCAVGYNTGLLKMLSIAFGGSIQPAKIKASKMFEYYSYISQNKNPKMIRHYYARVWYAFYKADSIPSDNAIVESLKKNYPKDSVGWINALHQQYPENPSEAYHIKLFIPVVWEDFYESENQLPYLRTKTKQAKWLSNKTEFLSLMKKTRIPKEYFDIKFYTLIYHGDKGTIYSNKVKAKAGVLCIIKPLLSKDDSIYIKYLPFIPSENDSLYFSFAGSK